MSLTTISQVSIDASEKPSVQDVFSISIPRKKAVLKNVIGTEKRSVSQSSSLSFMTSANSSRRSSLTSVPPDPGIEGEETYLERRSDVIASAHGAEELVRFTLKHY
mgnify:CR=1 FL=1